MPILCGGEPFRAFHNSCELKAASDEILSLADARGIRWHRQTSGFAEIARGWVVEEGGEESERWDLELDKDVGTPFGESVLLLEF